MTIVQLDGLINLFNRIVQTPTEKETDFWGTREWIPISDEDWEIFEPLVRNLEYTEEVKFGEHKIVVSHNGYTGHQHNIDQDGKHTDIKWGKDDETLHAISVYLNWLCGCNNYKKVKYEGLFKREE